MAVSRIQLSTRALHRLRAVDAAAAWGSRGSALGGARAAGERAPQAARAPRGDSPTAINKAFARLPGRVRQIIDAIG